MGVAIVSLIVLAIVGLVGGLLLFRVFGQAARDEDRLDGGGGEGGNRPTGSGEEGRRSLRLFLGRSASVLGVVVAVVGMVVDVNSAFVVTSVGIMLGGVGFGLGARRFGLAAVAASIVLLLFGLAVINGYVPGLNPPGYEQQ